MRRFSKISWLLSAALLAPVLAGCNAYRMKTPTGFAEVDHSDNGAHYKGANNIGLRVATFHNVKGGSLAFWSEDLVRKLGARGYVLTRHSPAKSKNGRSGTRFDFEYQPPGDDIAPRKYSVVLFVSDKHRVVMQLAGEADVLGAVSGQLDEIASATKIRGCRPWTDICDGAQPASIQAGPQPKPKAGNDAKKAEPTADPERAPTEIAEEDTARQGG